VTLQYRLDEQAEGGVTLPATLTGRPVSVGSVLAEPVPFKPMDRLFQAKDPVNAIGMGYRRTWTFVAQTYITLKRLIGGLISPKTLMGPVALLRSATRSWPAALYELHLLPRADQRDHRGHQLPAGAAVRRRPDLLMLIEKVKGSALSERTQGILAYAGWALVLLLLIYVTYNDIYRSFFS
jgi:regulator of sigma E protease